MTLALYVLWSFLAIYGLWLFYLAVMALKRARDEGKLSGVAYVLGVPILIAGYILDILINVTVCTVLFLDLPRHVTMSGRLSDYWTPEEATWRARLAGWFKRHLLDPFDPDGAHIK